MERIGCVTSYYLIQNLQIAPLGNTLVLPDLFIFSLFFFFFFGEREEIPR